MSAYFISRSRVLYGQTGEQMDLASDAQHTFYYIGWEII